MGGGGAIHKSQHDPDLRPDSLSLTSTVLNVALRLPLISGIRILHSLWTLGGRGGRKKASHALNGEHRFLTIADPPPP